MSATAQKLQLCYVPCQEYSATYSNLRAMAETLVSLVRSRRLRMYVDPAIREAAANCILAEDNGNVKIAKRTKNAKVDIIVAIAMAAVAATRHQGSSYNLYALADMPQPTVNPDPKVDPRDQSSAGVATTTAESLLRVGRHLRYRRPQQRPHVELVNKQMPSNDELLTIFYSASLVLAARSPSSCWFT
jgi:hypothetical protein